MDPVLLVITAHGIHDDVNTGLKGQFPLPFSSRRKLVLPVAGSVFRPRTPQAVGAVYDRGHGSKIYTFHEGAYNLAPSHPLYKEEGSVDGVIRPQPFQFPFGENSVHFPPEGTVESLSRSAPAIVSQESAPVLKVLS